MDTLHTSRTFPDNPLRKHASALIAVSLLLFGAFTAEPRSPGDSRYFSAVLLTRNIREASIDFGNNRVEHTAPEPILSYGVSIGRNIRLPFAGARLTLPFTFELGSAVERTLDYIVLDDGTNPDVDFATVMYAGGVHPMLQLPVRLTTDVWAYPMLGGSLMYSKISETERTSDSRNLRVLDRYLEEDRQFSAGLQAGFGMERALTSSMGIYLHYLFRYWYPVDRKTAHDLFPLEAKPYSERFFSHVFSIGVLLADPAR